MTTESNKGSTSKRTGAHARSATHVVGTSSGFEARMVDVGEKPVTARSATARATVLFPAGVLANVLSHGGPKGPILEVARLAGIQAAKRTDELIPLCHGLPLDHVEITIRARGDRELEIVCTAACTARTGVEMEALTGAAVAALTVIDMTKALDHGISIGAIELLEKRGGRSGTWTRAASNDKAKSGSRADRPQDGVRRGRARQGRGR